ncbi:type II toxin-antitoxin system RelE/ParE family toxin [Cyanosarcina cf. burmensis CCALA 770]|nr:type II toxin-antitoxin system RelE/ParE family toxin [Cyanosarcina cf. burmensis CCALA 770]
MKTFVLTEQAALDVESIWDYIADNSIDAADRARDELYAAMQKLAQMPGMGHLRLDLADERHRFWTVYPYLIVYRPNTQPLQILRVLHGARDIRSIL